MADLQLGINPVTFLDRKVRQAKTGFKAVVNRVAPPGVVKTLEKAEHSAQLAAELGEKLVMAPFKSGLAPTLLQALADPNPARRMAAWARLYTTGGPAMLEALSPDILKKNWEQSSTPVGGSPLENMTKGVTNREQLSQRLEPDVRPQVEALLDQLPQDEAHFSLLMAAARKLKKADLQAICGRLQEFLSRPGLEEGKKRTLVRDLLQDVANPSVINNLSGPTCSSTSAQVKLAMMNPKMYVDLVTSMAEGKDFTLPNGSIVKAKYPQGDYQECADLPGRSQSSERLFQDNVQNFGAEGSRAIPAAKRGLNGIHAYLTATRSPIAGPWGNLMKGWNAKDSDRYDPNSPGKQGHDPEQWSYLQEQFFGASPSSWVESTPDRMWREVEADLSQGKPVSVSLLDPQRFKTDAANAFHVVTVLAIDRTRNPAMVRYHTWGGEREIPLDEWKKSCLAVQTVNK